ncbi:Uu.00g084860.m01.CDS01 [Anthostomella pinea]|uniref:Uu.00g084860.m01.CDS01 n=1 Tax=Anthostomella pinea TaxID=933095 RepID=A0AAI8VN01_9PEZI|nr:Uu.00g084860.m01.CDS01 [Anthostomella pinea]
MFMMLLSLLFATLSLAEPLELTFRQSTACDSRPWRRDLALPLHNELAYQRYTLDITVGTPPLPYSLTVDTASSYLWVPLANSSGCAPDPCPAGGFDPEDSSTSIATGVPFDVSYGLEPGHTVLGQFYNDTVTVGGAVMPNMTIGACDVPPDIFGSGIWGLIGLGPPVSPDGQANDTIPPLWQSLYQHGYASKQLFSLWLNRQSAETGSILFGGIDETKFEGELKSLPVVTQGRDRVWSEWAVNLTSVAYVGADGTAVNLTGEGRNITTVLDSAAPNMYLPTEIYDDVAARMNATIVQTFPYVSCELRNSTKGLEFGFGFESGGPRVRVPYGEVIYPFGDPANIGEITDDEGRELCYLGLIGTPGPIFLLGATFIRSVYLVFDYDEGKISMGSVKYD